MPCLNPGHYLDAAIASALEQPELTQLVVAHGGSNAESLEQLEQWRIRDLGVEWFSEPDDGPADALKKALARARAAWDDQRSSNEGSRNERFQLSSSSVREGW